MYHREDDELCKEIIKKLKEYGIQTNIDSGQIYYDGQCTVGLECHALYLLRHAETYGTKYNKFMSDISSNSRLTVSGIEKLLKTAKQIETMKFDYILYSKIPRVKETSDILRREIGKKACFVEVSWMKGIDNAGWEEKGKDELTEVDMEDFYQREVLHNIFAKSSRGCCWGMVLSRCIELVKYINENYKNRRILLVSQGSILIGLQIILHLEKKPWEKYDSDSFFSLKKSTQHNYGQIQHIYELSND